MHRKSTSQVKNKNSIWEFAQIFTCPKDKTVLKLTTPNNWSCNSCNRLYSLSEGVIRLIDEEDSFYEDAYHNQVHFLPRRESILYTWPLWLICNGYPWLVRKFVPHGSVTVELGCAGGMEYFGSRYNMIGVDISWKSLVRSCKSYALNVQADVTRGIPLGENSVDSVISSYFWEHISPSIKPKLLQECHRILRPNGKLVFLFDVQTSNPLIAPYQQAYPSIYQTLFLEGDGHIGYELPRINLEHFLKAGFEIVQYQCLEKTFFQSPSVFTKLSQFPVRMAFLYRIVETIMRTPLFYPYLFFVRLIDALTLRALPDDWGRIMIIVAQKKAHEE